MADRPPAETTNLDIYGNATLEWSRVLMALSVPPDESRNLAANPASSISIGLGSLAPSHLAPPAGGSPASEM